MERQTQRYTDILITILVHGGLQGDECILCYVIPCLSNHRPLQTFQNDFSTLVYLQMDHYKSQWLNSPLILHTLLT